MSRSGPGTIVQICFVVDDIDAAMATWTGTRGAGPFFLLRHFADPRARYRGREVPLDISLAMGQLGPLHVELIQPHGNLPNVYRDMYPPGTSGFHHTCTAITDLDTARAELEAGGATVGMELTFGETPVVYMDTRSSVGHMTELVRADRQILALYDRVATAAHDWDGTDPVRSL